MLRKRLNNTIASLSLTGRLVFWLLSVVFIISSLSLLWQLNEYFMVNIPSHGGVIREGLVGLPRFINPVLAITDADKDISSLIYSGLMRETSDGGLIPDIAQSYTISTDEKVYTFTLQPNAKFHDGSRVTADDIIFTVNHVQSANIKSPKRASWMGVTVEKVNDTVVKFTLPQPYAPFLENTTLGILPKHLWQDDNDEAFALDKLNISPIGSGPYKVSSIKKDYNDIPVSFELKANSKYILGYPYIDKIIFKFFATEKLAEDAFVSNEIDSLSGLSPDTASTFKNNGAIIYSPSLPRVFGLFFNQNENVALSSPEVRKALDMSISRDYIVNTVLRSYGTVLNGPVPPQFLLDSPSLSTTSSQKGDLVDQANLLLEKNGWIRGEDGIRFKKTKQGTTTLAFSISTSDSTELRLVANIMATKWRSIGAKVSVKMFEGGYLNQNIIRPRKYESLLFGQIINKDLDLYAFWHSSQKNDPGLNISLYNNTKADKILEKIRVENNEQNRMVLYKQFTDLLAIDTPAVFLYSPDLVYATSKPMIKDIKMDHITLPSDRFANIYKWYIKTEEVWSIFATKIN